MTTPVLRVSHAMRAVIISACIITVTLTGIVLNYVIATWRADQAVRQSEQQLCQIIRLVTDHPVTKPADPAENPSRVQNYELYEAFMTVGRQYRC
jgi:hypothetical protein